MTVNFQELQDYLNKYGYPYNEMMEFDSFQVPDATAYEYLMQNISRYDGIEAMTFFGRKIKYHELAEQIDRTADAMKGIGQSATDRIATLLPNIPEATYMQYGTSKIGAVPSNIDPRTSGKMLLNYIKNEQIKNIVVVDVMYETAIRPIEHELKEQYGIDKIIVIPATNSLPSALKELLSFKEKMSHKQSISSDVLDIIYWDDLIASTRYEHATDVGFQPNKEAVIQHSSGTSKGIPKSIPLTNENVNSFVEKHIPTIFGSIPSGTKMLNILPYFASYGAINTSHLGLNFGLTLQQIPEFKFEDFGYIATQQKSEILIGTPTWYSLMIKDKRLRKNALKHVIMAISGGDSIDQKTKDAVDQFLREHGAQCRLTNGHGMSELAGSGCYQFPGHQSGVDVGIPFPYDKYIILDKDRHIVPMTENGVKGCTWIYSPSATSGSFDGHQFGETVDINGFRFLNSKDTMLIMPNNEITFIEREDRTFTRFDGHKIVPYDVESIFAKHELVKQCMVLPYTDEKIKGRMPIAYIVPVRELSEEEMDKIVYDITNAMLSSDNTNNRDIPRKVCFLTEMPKNAMSKNDFRALEDRELDGSEYTIDIVETNLASSNVKILVPQTREHGKVLVLK